MTAVSLLATPFHDRAGRFSRLKTAVLIAAALPAAHVLWLFESGRFALPIEQAILETGEWSLRLLLVTLAVTPLSRIAGWPRLLLVRRILGLASFFYLALHVWLYVMGQGYDATKITHELFARAFLTVGLAATLGLTALAATSFDKAVTWLGPNWAALHRAIYALTGLSLLHYFLLTKVDATEATVLLGLFVLLMAFRAVPAAWLRRPAMLAAAAVLAALATAGLEAAWYAIATGVDVKAIAEANLAFPAYIRPAWIVLLAGLAVALVPMLGRWRSAVRKVSPSAG
jgi:methionine sulfoxide reductase heme-binding subunit